MRPSARCRSFPASRCSPMAGLHWCWIPRAFCEGGEYDRRPRTRRAPTRWATRGRQHRRRARSDGAVAADESADHGQRAGDPGGAARGGAGADRQAGPGDRRGRHAGPRRPDGADGAGVPGCHGEPAGGDPPGASSRAVPRGGRGDRAVGHARGREHSRRGVPHRALREAGHAPAHVGAEPGGRHGGRGADGELPEFRCGGRTRDLHRHAVPDRRAPGERAGPLPSAAGQRVTARDPACDPARGVMNAQPQQSVDVQPGPSAAVAMAFEAAAPPNGVQEGVGAVNGGGANGGAAAAPRRAGRGRGNPVRSQRDLELLRALARRINPRDAGANNNLGVVYYHKDLLEEAIYHFECALELDPRMQIAQRNLQIAYFHTGYYQELVEELKARLEADASDIEARTRLARAYLYGGDAAAAARELRQLLIHRPDDTALRLKLARAERNRGALDLALAELNEAAARDASNARIHLELGDLHYSRGSNVEAQLALERAIALDPSLAEAHYLLAFVYGDQGDLTRADAARARAAELNPSIARAEKNLSLDRFSAARYDELVGDRAPRPEVVDGALAHYNIALALRQRGLYEEAAREFEQALKRGEDAGLVRQALAELSLLRGRGEEAAGLYDALLEQEKGSPKLWNERGVAAHQCGRLEEAESAY